MIHMRCIDCAYNNLAKGIRLLDKKHFLYRKKFMEVRSLKDISHYANTTNVVINFAVKGFFHCIKKTNGNGKSGLHFEMMPCPTRMIYHNAVTKLVYACIAGKYNQPIVQLCIFISYISYLLYCCTLPDKRCLSHGMCLYQVMMALMKLKQDKN